MPRKIVTVDDRDAALGEVREFYLKRLQEKGPHSFASIHEILGILIEELNNELVEAVRENDHEKVRKELLDIAVACVHGVASLEYVDW